MNLENLIREKKQGDSPQRKGRTALAMTCTSLKLARPTTQTKKNAYLFNDFSAQVSIGIVIGIGPHRDDGGKELRELKFSINWASCISADTMSVNTFKFSRVALPSKKRMQIVDVGRNMSNEHGRPHKAQRACRVTPPIPMPRPPQSNVT
jgi:hypothetical protein